MWLAGIQSLHKASKHLLAKHILLRAMDGSFCYSVGMDGWINEWRILRAQDGGWHNKSFTLCQDVHISVAVVVFDRGTDGGGEDWG